MNTIAHLLWPEDILLDLDVPNQRRLFDEIGRHLAETHGMPPEWVTLILTRREHAGSTGLGEGFAIPHARVPDLDRIHLFTSASNRQFRSLPRTANQCPTSSSSWCQGQPVKSISEFLPMRRKCSPITSFAKACARARTRPKSSDSSTSGRLPRDLKGRHLYLLLIATRRIYSPS